MKKIIFSTAVLGALLLGLTSCNEASKTEKEAEGEAVAASGAIVYFNLDKVLQEYDMANDLRSTVETKVNSINQEVNRRGSKLERDQKEFQDKMNKGLMTQSVAEVKYRKLQEDQANFQNYAAQKQQEIAEEQQVMMNQLADAIKSFVDEYNAKMGYALILTTQGDILPAPVVTGDTSLDITDQILEGLNAEYVKAKAKEGK